MRIFSGLVISLLLLAGCSSTHGLEEAADTQSQDDTNTVSAQVAELESCTQGSPFEPGKFEGQIVWFSCGPDDLWHPQFPLVEVTSQDQDNPNAGGFGEKETTTPTPRTVLLKPVDSDLSLDNISEYDVPQIAVDEFWSYLERQPKETNFKNLDVHISPNAPAEYSQAQIQNLKTVISGFKTFVWPEKLTVLIYVPEDAEWASEYCNEVIQGNSCERIDNAAAQGYADNAGSPSDTGVNYFTIGINGEQSDSNNGNRTSVITHEYWHVLTVLPNGSWKAPIQQSPLWFVEGTADFMGDAFRGFPKSGQMWNSKAFDPWNEGYDETRFAKVMHSMTPEIAREIYQMLESGDFAIGEKASHYELGNYATEVLIAVYGFETFLEFSTFSGGDWPAHFQDIFGVSTQDFYAKLAPYLRVRLDY